MAIPLERLMDIIFLIAMIIHTEWNPPLDILHQHLPQVAFRKNKTYV